MLGKKYYCKNCGRKFSTIEALRSSKCLKSPNGALKGYHELYEGDEKKSYTCKYCGRRFSSIETMTSGKCLKHPDGALRGYHSPAL